MRAEVSLPDRATCEHIVVISSRGGILHMATVTQISILLLSPCIVNHLISNVKFAVVELNKRIETNSCEERQVMQTSLKCATEA